MHRVLYEVLIHYDHRRERCLQTRENEDEEGADSSNNTDDITHVRHKHGDEKSDGDPDHSENHSAATLKRMSDDSAAVPLDTQDQV